MKCNVAYLVNSGAGPGSSGELGARQTRVVAESEHCWERSCVQGVDAELSKALLSWESSAHGQRPANSPAVPGGLGRTAHPTLTHIILNYNHSFLLPILLCFIIFKYSSKTLYYLLFFCFYRAAPMAYASSQVRGQIGAIAASLHHSHSNSGSELCLRPTPQLAATLDSQPTEGCHGLNLHPHGY